jgi:hypothetical protein
MEINFYSKIGAEFTFAMTKKISFEMIVGIVPWTYNIFCISQKPSRLFKITPISSLEYCSNFH